MSTTNERISGVLQRLRHAALLQHCGQLTDHDLLERYIGARDESAFALLVKRHGPMILALCWRILRQQQDAEDAFQATFLVLARKCSAIRKREAVASWLHRVAFRAANKLRCTRARRQARETPWFDLPQMGCSDDLGTQETQRLLEEELNRLADKYRAPLLLCCVQGRTRDEAAQQLGWSVGVLRGRLDRGRQLLRARLARRGVALSAALLPLGLAGTSEAALLPELLCTTVRAAMTAGHAGAVAVSAQAVALSQGVMNAMFLAKLKVIAVVLATLTFLGTGVGLVTYNARAQGDLNDVRRVQRTSDSRQPTRADQVADLRREVERLRLELEQARLLLKSANEEILRLRAARAQSRNDVTDPTAPANRFGKGAAEKVPQREDKERPGADKLPARDDKAAPRTGQVTWPDRKVVATGDGSFIILLDAATGKELRHFAGHAGRVTAVAFSLDGKLLASGSKDKSVRLWDIQTGKEVVRIAQQAPVESLRFTADGRMLVIDAQGQQSQVDVATGKLIRLYQPDKEKVR